MKLRKLPIYTKQPDGSTAKADSQKWYAVFADAGGAIRRMPLFEDRKQSDRAADKIDDLVKYRRAGMVLTPDLVQFVANTPAAIRNRLADWGIIEDTTASTSTPLKTHLHGVVDVGGHVVEVGYAQHMRSEGCDPKSVTKAVQRVETILDACNFVMWKDISSANASDKVQKFLARRLDAAGKPKGKRFNLATACYYVSALKTFCRWLKKSERVPTIAMEALNLSKKNIEVVKYRPLTTDEVQRLVVTAVNGGAVYRVAGPDRAMLYLFAYSTGLRPKAIKSLKVSSFHLDANPPVVVTKAKNNKRRERHVQQLKPAMVDSLRLRFVGKSPDDVALVVPDLTDAARMLRVDLKAAREAWLGETEDREEIRRRKQSDFLAVMNHEGERSSFYSLRHGHAQALAEAGVPELAIAASMHHADRSTTARYLHANRASVNLAISAMPDVVLPKRQNSVSPALSLNPPHTRAFLESSLTIGNASMEQNQSEKQGDDESTSKWAHSDSNREPRNYEFPALTVEL